MKRVLEDLFLGPVASPSFSQGFRSEDSRRRVRVVFADVTIADSKHVMLLHEFGRLPVFYFPVTDVRMDLLEESEHHTHSPLKGEASYWTLRVGDRIAEHAAWSYPQHLHEGPQIQDYVAFYWDLMNAWYEEEQQVYAHARDPYKRVDILPSSRHVRVVLGGVTIADTHHPLLLLETGLPIRYYIPEQDIHMEFLNAAETTSRCPYKGMATYWSASIGEKVFKDIVWSYREPPNIPEEHLRACLQDQYDLSLATLEFLPRGRDYNAGVYRVVSEQGTVYLLKVTARPLYEPSCLVPRYLKDQGITSVVAPIPTRSSALWTKLVDLTAIVYPFIDGDSSLTGMTNEQWKEVGSIFKRIHQAPLPPGGFPSLRTETFDPTEYTRWVQTFETQYLPSQPSGSGSSRILRAAWVEHVSTIHTAVTSLERMAELLQRHAGPYVICHADLHARNLIRDGAGHVFVIDWDEVMLAPKERDFIFIREPQADAFWEGYGQKEIDWMLLSYYLWERVVQDVIEDTQNVCFKDDQGTCRDIPCG